MPCCFWRVFVRDLNTLWFKTFRNISTPKFMSVHFTINFFLLVLVVFHHPIGRNENEMKDGPFPAELGRLPLRLLMALDRHKCWEITPWIVFLCFMCTFCPSFDTASSATCNKLYVPASSYHNGRCCLPPSNTHSISTTISLRISSSHHLHLMCVKEMTSKLR